MTKSQTCLLKPVISEESLKSLDAHNEYTFLVGRGATKAKIKEAIEKSFGVQVRGVRTKHVHGKTRRRGSKRLSVSMPDVIKAVVKLAPKDKISLFETKEKKKAKK